MTMDNEKSALAQTLRKEFADDVEQIAHDLQAPLSSLLMIVKHATDVPEKIRENIQEVIVCIEDVANNLRNRYKNAPIQSVSKQLEVNDNTHNNNDVQVILLSTIVLEILTEKKYQYQDLPLKFESKITSVGYFSFVKFDLPLLRGIISDLLDRAIMASKGNNAIFITVRLDNDGLLTKLSIEDNGASLSSEIVIKLMNNLDMDNSELVQYKELLSIRDLMVNNQCRFTIKSQEGKGTKITLILPMVTAPSWIIDCIELQRGDSIIILDDESFIHKAWDTRFKVEAPYIKIKHFEVAIEAINFINSLSTEEKQKICLLVDYELARNEPSGIQVIKQLKLDRSILVTNHYDSTAVRVEALEAKSKILPKQLALEVPLKVVMPAKIKTADGTYAHAPHEVNLVVVDDDPVFIKNLCKFVFNDRITDSYNDPQDFLDNVLKYPKDITILLDYDFGEGKLSGIELSRELHKLGFTAFRILSGHAFDQRDIPNYVGTFAKTDLDTIKQF